MARRRFFVDEVQDERARLAGVDAHHLTRVLRVETGQRYEVSDNRNVYLAEVESVAKELVTFRIVERLVVPEPSIRITLLASLIRFERFEMLLEKATELGVERVIPILADRSEKGLDRAAEKRSGRWQRIVREASEQARRTRLPQVCEPLRLQQASTADAALRLMLDEDPASQPILLALPQHKLPHLEVALLLGPEGGWTDRERAVVSEKWRSVSLGPLILRAETAAIAALAILNAAWQAEA